MVTDIVHLYVNTDMWVMVLSFLFFLSLCSVCMVNLQIVLSFPFYFCSCSCVCVLQCVKAIRTFQTWWSQLWKLQRKLAENCNWWIGELIKITGGNLGSMDKQVKFPSCWRILVMALPGGIQLQPCLEGAGRLNHVVIWGGTIVQYKVYLDSSVFRLLWSVAVCTGPK